MAYIFNVKYFKRDEIIVRNGYINIIRNEKINKNMRKSSSMHEKSTQRTLCSLLYGILPHHFTIYDPMCIYNI